MKNMDKLFNIFYCKCEIITCFQRGCKEDCLLKLHIICDCPRDHKIPLLEIPFVKDQREKIGRGKLEMGGIDLEETERLQRQIDRTRKDLESLMRRLEEAKAAQNQIAGTSSAQDEEEMEDNDKDTDFQVNIIKKSKQNRLNLTNLARESLRGGASVRLTSSLATAVLLDLNIVTKEDASLVIDPSKVQRAREKVMREERIEAHEKLDDTKLECVFFDARKDQTKMVVVDEDGEEFARTLSEEHYTLTDPHNYLTHLTPVEGTGAQGTADVVLDYFKEVDQVENVKVLGGDSTNSMTGWEGGAIHLIEVGKGEKVLWDICLLHTNELPLRHLMKDQGMETSGKNSFTGDIGKMIKEDVHLFEVNERFETISVGEDLPEIPEEIVSQLSTDQKYLYKVVKMIRTGHLDHNVLKQVVGCLNHSRWLTCASRLCRLWLSKHSFRRNSKNYKSLKILIRFIVSVYAKMWFEIKCSPHILNGPRHMLKTVQLVSTYCTDSVKQVVMPVIQRGAWHAHSENMLLAMLGSEDEKQRHFAIKKITEIRGKDNFGDKSVRSFHVPTLNWQASGLYNLIDWTGESDPVFEPILTSDFSTEQLKQFLDKPFPVSDIPCHTQSCERAVKETTIAASKVFGFERRDGLIRNKVKSRKLVPKVRTKKSFQGMIDA